MQRTTTRTVTFQRPFLLEGFEETLPASAYTVETDEEVMQDVSFPVWRRVSAAIVIKGIGSEEHVAIDPHKLDTMILRDAAPPSINAESP